MDEGMGITIIQTYINVESDLRGCVPGEIQRVESIELFKDLGEGVGVMGPKGEDIVYDKQPEAELTQLRAEVVLFKETQEGIATKWGNMRFNYSIHGDFSISSV